MFEVSELYQKNLVLSTTKKKILEIRNIYFSY